MPRVQGSHADQADNLHSVQCGEGDSAGTCSQGSQELANLVDAVLGGRCTCCRKGGKACRVIIFYNCKLVNGVPQARNPKMKRVYACLECTVKARMYTSKDHYWKPKWFPRWAQTVKTVDIT